MSNGISDIALMRGEGIEQYGLTFYPLTMERYEEWNACKGVLTLRMSALPALYAAMPYLSALYAMDMDALMAGNDAPGFTARILRLLCMAMNVPAEEPQQFIKLMCKNDDPRTLTEITISNGQTMAHVTPARFGKIRELLAAQNAAELPDEAENIELIRAQQERNRSQTQVHYDFSTMIASVAYESGVTEKDVLGWTIREFTNRQSAITRSKAHLINGMAEGNGAKWKGGNPYPSWCFDREESLTGGFMSESEMLNKLGKVGNIKS